MWKLELSCITISNTDLFFPFTLQVILVIMKATLDSFGHFFCGRLYAEDTSALVRVRDRDITNNTIFCQLQFLEMTLTIV